MKATPKNIFITSIFFLFTIYSVHSQSGSLDLTFGVGGKVIAPIGSSNDNGLGIVIQPDGKILVAGSSDNGSGFYWFAVTRHNNDGSMDTTFDYDGKVTTGISATSVAKSIALQSDGKIVAGGTTTNGLGSDYAITRYNIDGSLDTSFDFDGKVTADFSTSDVGYSLKIQNDNKIVIAGNTFSFGENYPTIIRYLNNGALDTTFEADGIVSVFVPGFTTQIASLEIQSDGKLIVGGLSDNGTQYDFAVLRFNINGSLDSTFDSDGIVTTSFGSSGNSSGKSITIQSDNKILLAGSVYDGTNYDYAIARYNTDGSLDTTFATTGLLTFGVGLTNDAPQDVKVQNDGKIIVAGSSYIGGFNDFSMARLNSDGSFDNSFDSDGMVTTGFGLEDNAFGIAIQSDGKIILAGNSENGSDTDFALARYNFLPVNIIENYFTNSIGIFPNPSNGKFAIDDSNLKEKIKTIKIYSILGEIILNQIYTNEINLSESPKGIYFIELATEQNIYTTKIIFQ